MDKILGLGSAGCNIAACFEKYPQYTIRKIDCEDKTDKNYIKIPKQDSAEYYELFCPNLVHELRCLKGDLLFIVCGAATISGATLALLTQLKDVCNINVLYICADAASLSETKKLQERAVFHVLQEYARSGLLDGIYLVDNAKLEEIVDNAPIIGYYNKLNEVVVSAMHMINIFKHTKPIVDTFGKSKIANRIMTLGISNLDKKEEKLFFDLDEVSEKCYYYGIPEGKLKTDGSLIKKIRSKTNDDVETSYGVYSTAYDNELVYCLLKTSLTQQR